MLCNLEEFLVTSFKNRARMSKPLVLQMRRWEGIRVEKIISEVLEEVTEDDEVPEMVWNGPE